MNEKKSGSMIGDALILFAITLIAGLVLGTVYQVTKEPIAVQKEKAKQEACMEVFQDAVSFEETEVLAADGVSQAMRGGAGLRRRGHRSGYGGKRCGRRNAGLCDYGQRS